jgi:1,5-anhydro-D-fructose reductase (1,5-anhydro-D-mannitol-forming)
MGTGVHVVDALRFVLAQEIVEVAAISDGQTPSQPLEQLLAMALRFERGAIATVCCGRRLPDSRNDLVVYGSLGRLIGRDALWESRQGTFEVVSEAIHTTDTYPPQPLANFIDELDDFHRAIREDREPAANGLDGLRVVQVTLAMIASARDGRTVRLEPLTA